MNCVCVRVSQSYGGLIKSVAQRKWIYLFLVERDGNHCHTCGKTDQEIELVIHHIDGDPRNNDPANLNLQCRSDNEKEIWKARLKKKGGYRLQSDSVTTPLCVCDHEGVSEAGESASIVSSERGENLVKMSLEGSVEHKLNRRNEPAFRRYVVDRLLKGELRVYDAITGGAEFCSMSPVTARRYLTKMTSVEGNLLVVTGAGNELFLQFRPNIDERK